MGFKIGFESFQFMTKFGMCCPIMNFTRMHIKDLGNNAVCERAEAYQSNFSS